METTLRRKLLSSLRMTAIFAAVVAAFFFSRSCSTYFDNFLVSALFMVVIKLCMCLYALYWLSEIIDIWGSGAAELSAQKKELR